MLPANICLLRHLEIELYELSYFKYQGRKYFPSTWDRNWVQQILILREKALVHLSSIDENLWISIFLN